LSTAEVIGGGVAAVLLFWAVGAYNRLVRLRAAIVRQFGPVDEQMRQRHELLLQFADTLAPLLANAAPRLDALRAACQQVVTACAQARLRPGSSGAITSLRVADDILAESRARLPPPNVPGSELAELGARLQASDATLAFARAQFNQAVDEYGRAVTQFPTVLLVGLFGFRRATPL
jgi:LemA protein